MMDKELEKTLIGFQVYDHHGLAYQLKSEDVQTLTLAIKAALRDNLPKERGKSKFWSADGDYKIFTEGYSRAIQDVKEILS